MEIVATKAFVDENDIIYESQTGFNLEDVLMYEEYVVGPLMEMNKEITIVVFATSDAICVLIPFKKFHSMRQKFLRDRNDVTKLN